MDSQLPKQSGFQIRGGNYSESVTSNNIQVQGNTVNFLGRNQQLIFVIAGISYEIHRISLKIIENHLQKISGDKQLKVSSIEEGNLKINGSLLSLKQLRELFVEGRLLEVSEIPIQDVYFSSDDIQESNEKSALIKDILDNGAFGKDLTGTDLSSANLSGADLSSSDLSPFLSLS